MGSDSLSSPKSGVRPCLFGTAPNRLSNSLSQLVLSRTLSQSEGFRGWVPLGQSGRKSKKPRMVRGSERPPTRLSELAGLGLAETEGFEPGPGGNAGPVGASSPLEAKNECPCKPQKAPDSAPNSAPGLRSKPSVALKALARAICASIGPANPIAIGGRCQSISSRRAHRLAPSPTPACPARSLSWPPSGPSMAVF